MKLEKKMNTQILQKLQIKNDGTQILKTNIKFKSPEHNLWASVLQQAIEDAERLFKKFENNVHLASKPKFQVSVLELSTFFLSSSNRVGSISYICNQFDIHPKHCRNRVLKKFLIPMLKSIIASFNDK